MSVTKYPSNSRSDTKIKPAAFYRRKWEEFVADNSLADVLLCDYYLGGSLPAGQRGWASHEKLLAELFKDAMAVGAVVLPSPYMADDFGFEIRVAKRCTVMSQPIYTTLKTAPHLGAHNNGKLEQHSSSQYYLAKRCTMSESNIPMMLQNMVEAAYELIVQEEAASSSQSNQI